MFSSYRNIVSVTIAVIKYYGLPITNTSVNDSIENHPDYPSLLSITDSFDRWNIPCQALSVEAEKFTDIPTPFVTYINVNGGMFVFVLEIKNGKVAYTTTKISALIFAEIEDFLEMWNGVIVLVSPTNESREPNYRKARQQEIITQLKIPVLID